MSKVVITGGSGFIGSNLCKWFEENEPDTQVVILDPSVPQVPLRQNLTYVYGDIRNLNSLLPVFEGADEVYNLAGILGTSELIPIASLATDVNITGATNVFDAARICKVPKIYNVAKPHFAGYHENAYTLTKHAAENIGLMYRDTYNMDIATVRWMNAVGPFQHLFPIRKFVPTMVLFALYGIDLEIYGSGNQTIDPIDARDMCDYTVYACRNLGRSDRVIDLGSGTSITCNDTAQLVLEVLHEIGYRSQSSIVHLPMRDGEKPDCLIKANTEYWDALGMKPQYTFKESLIAYFDYLLSHVSVLERLNAIRFYGKNPKHPVMVQ